jgi:hypothetical protein
LQTSFKAPQKSNLQALVGGQDASASRFANMTYFEKLHPWCIIRPLPNMQRRIVARCRRRNDAESHVKILRQLTPNIPYEIVFDMLPDESEVDPP